MSESGEGSNAGDGVPPSSSGDHITIKVKTLAPNTYTLTVSRQLLTEELKEQLEPLADMPAGRQRLIYRGRMLENGSTLGSAGIEDGHTLHLVERPADAPPPQPAPHAGQHSPADGAGGAAAPQQQQRVSIGAINVPVDIVTGLPDMNQLMIQMLGSMGIAPPPPGATPPHFPGDVQGFNPPPPFPEGMPDMNEVVSQLFGALGIPNLQVDLSAGGDDPARVAQEGQHGLRRPPGPGAVRMGPEPPPRPQQQQSGGSPPGPYAPQQQAGGGQQQQVGDQQQQGMARPHIIAAIQSFLQRLEAMPLPLAAAQDVPVVSPTPYDPAGGQSSVPAPPQLMARLIQAARGVIEDMDNVDPQVRQALESISRYAVGQQPSGPQQQPDPQLMIVVRAALAQLLRRSARYIRDRGLSQMETLVTSLEQGPALTQQGGIEPAVSSLHSLSRILGAVGLLLLDLARLAGQVHGFQAGDMGPLLRASPSNARPFQVAMEAGALGGRQQQPQVRVHLQMAGPSGRAGPARFVRSPMSADEQQHQSVQQPTAQQPQDVPEGLEEMLTRLLPGMMERAVTSALQQHQLQAASTPPPSSASSSRSPQAVHSTAQAQPQQIAGGVPPPSNQLTSEAASGGEVLQAEVVSDTTGSAAQPESSSQAARLAGLGAGLGTGHGRGLGGGLPPRGRSSRGTGRPIPAGVREEGRVPAEVIQRTSAPPGGIGRGAGGLADIVNSLLSGPGGESLMTMASQMAQSPEMAQIADQFLGPPPSSSAGQGAGGQARPPPNLGQLMSNMMPMVQTMLGGLQPQGGRGSRVSPSAGTHANSPGGLEGDGEDWRSSLSAEELANWEAVMAADEEAMVAAESTDRPPLSDVYLAGGRTPSTQSRNPFS